MQSLEVLHPSSTVVHVVRRYVYCSTVGPTEGSVDAQDVDLLISQEFSDAADADSSGSQSPLNAAQLKDLVLRANSRNFYLKLPRDPAAEYRILWYRQYYRGPECKVDILVPATMHLPFLPASRVVHLTATDTATPAPVPVVPFPLLLLHKLQGWDDHRKAEEPYKRKKKIQDASDVRKLLSLRHEVEALEHTQPWDDEELFSEEFRKITRERVKAHCEAFPDREKEWKALGFETS